MTIRSATPEDAADILAIYAPIVQDTVISFETAVPTVEAMSERIRATLPMLPWLVSVAADGRIDGYAYAAKHRDRAAYRWSVDASAYIRADRRGRGLGRALYQALFEELRQLGYCEAFAGITVPNEASVGLHRACGFELIGVYRRVGFKLGAWHDVSWWQKSLALREIPAEPKRRRRQEG
jgi:phosphinothricin acetyltransferase